MIHEALKEAETAFSLGYVPIGAVVIYNKEIIARAHNGLKPFEHAEFLVLQQAYEIIGENVRKSTLYVTLEPCMMCFGMIGHLQIPRIYFGAYNLKEGASSHQLLHKPEIYGGIEEAKCASLLKKYFKIKR